MTLKISRSTQWLFLARVVFAAGLLAGGQRLNAQFPAVPAPLNNDAGTDNPAPDQTFGHPDRFPAVTFSEGAFIAIWGGRDTGGSLGSDYEVFFAVGTNGGQTWTNPAALNTNAGPDSIGDDFPTDVACRGAGRCIATWTTNDPIFAAGQPGTDDHEVIVATSDNGGTTWSLAQPLNSDWCTDCATVQSGGTCGPQQFQCGLPDSNGRIAYAGPGSERWIAAWQKNSGSPTKTRTRVARSDDDGGTWNDAFDLDPSAVFNSGTDDDGPVAIAADGQGHVNAVWKRDIGDATDIFTARSADAGATWTVPVRLHNDAESDIRFDGGTKGTGPIGPHIVTGGGTWIAVWNGCIPTPVRFCCPSPNNDSCSGIPFQNRADWDLLFVRSVDFGQTWSAPAYLNTNAQSDSGNDTWPRFATDKQGHWVVVWQLKDSFGGATGTDDDIFVAVSEDDGLSWSPAVPLATNAEDDTGDDSRPQLASDGAGHYVVAWESTDSLGDTIGSDFDILTVNFSFPANSPPECSAGGPYETECDGNTTSLILDATGSSDPDEDPLTYSWSTDCPGASFNDSTLVAPALTIDSAAGCSLACSVSLSATDDDAASGTCSIDVMIVDTTGPTIACPPDVTLECPSDTGVSSNGSAFGSDLCGSVTITSDDLVILGCGDEKTIARSWTATDECGNSSACDQVVNVADTGPPSVSLTGSPLLAVVGSSITFSAAFTDDCGAPHSVAWDFGDGSPPLAQSAVTSPAVASHVYAVQGIYMIVVAITDDCGNSGSDSVMVVVYDPADGFTTGSGWFVPDPTSFINNVGVTDTMSKANFGFIVKYQQGASNPNGNLEFHYKAGDIYLKSSRLEWMVVTSTTKVRFKGHATINGAGLYTFKVTAEDHGEPGTADTLKIEIWTGVVDTENGPPTPKHMAQGVLRGGNIQIHH